MIKPASQGMKFFSPKAFEHLLFKLHNSAYREIERQLQEREQQFPGTLKGLCTIFDLNFSNASTQGAVIPASAVVAGRPSFDVHVRIDESQIRRAAKCDGVLVGLVPTHAAFGDQRANTNHLILALQSDGVKQIFIVPLPLVLQAFEARVCKPNTYQVYQHTLIRQKAPLAAGAIAMTPTLEGYMEGASSYVGITSRTWQQRYMEHLYATRRGSLLRFHRALGGQLFDVYAHEHIVLRAGLNRTQALHVEEVEVEENTLHGAHPNGLNMIPGGEAGLRFLSTMTKRPAGSIQIDEIDALLETAVNDSLRPPALGEAVHQTNAKLAALWRDDIAFRIKAMTHQACRMSYQQISNARLWHASGWSLEKIHQILQGMDGRIVTPEQIQSLLDGKTYTSIPHVMLPLDLAGQVAQETQPSAYQ